MRHTAVTALALILAPHPVSAQSSFMTNAPQAWIDALAPSSDTVVAAVEQTSDRDFTDEHGASHRLEVGALQLEAWICTGAGWQLIKVTEHKLLYLRRDGLP